LQDLVIHENTKCIYRNKEGNSLEQKVERIHVESTYTPKTTKHARISFNAAFTHLQLGQALKPAQNNRARNIIRQQQPISSHRGEVRIKVCRFGLASRAGCGGVHKLFKAHVAVAWREEKSGRPNVGG